MPAEGRGSARLVVLNYNGGPHLRRCFDALAALDWPADRLELVLVDNASTDGSVEALQRSHPRVRVVRNQRNTGFPANNLGLTDLDGLDYVGLVNNDGFVEPGWLRALAGVLDGHPEVGAVGAKMLFAPRFVRLSLQTTAGVAGRGDPRELGVMVSGARVGGVDRWGDVQFGPGTWGPERGPQGIYRWTSSDAQLHIPLPGDGSDALPVVVELEMAAEGSKEVTLSHGPSTEAFVVDGRPRWCSVRVEAPAGDSELHGREPYDIVQNAGSMVFDDGSGADRGFGEPDEGQFDEPAEIFAWCGGSVLLRPSYVRSTGMFDERFFLYYEDTDWSWRGRAQGWGYRYEPTAVMRHVHAASSVEGSALFQHYVERNRLLMLAKNAPWRMLAGQVARYVLVTASYARRDLLAPVLRARRPRWSTTGGRVRAFLGFLRLAPTMFVQRRALRRRQTVSDEQLARWLVERGSP